MLAGKSEAGEVGTDPVLIKWLFRAAGARGGASCFTLGAQVGRIDLMGGLGKGGPGERP